MAQMHPALHSIFIKSASLQFFNQKEWFYLKKIATSAHIRIFQAFRIYINFYSNLKIEPAAHTDPLRRTSSYFKSAPIVLKLQYPL